MKYINCNYLYYAEDLADINVVDTSKSDYHFNMKDIALLRYKNFTSTEKNFWVREDNEIKTYRSLTSEFIIADTDLNALTYFMSDRLYIKADLLPIIRYENIKELLKVVKGNAFFLRKEKSIGAILFNKQILETKYVATDDIKDLYKNSLLENGFEVVDVLTCWEIKRFERRFRNIYQRDVKKEDLNNIFNINPRVNDMRLMPMTELINEINPTVKIRNVLGIFEDRFYSAEDNKEKEKLIDFYSEIGYNYFFECDEQMQHYRSFSLTMMLNYLSLSRIDREVISRANVIHDSHYQSYIELLEFKEFYYKQLEDYASTLNEKKK